MTTDGNPIRVGGVTPFTTIDFPGCLAAVIFCQGCPWRCCYCHNPHLQPFEPIPFQRSGSAKSWGEVQGFLERRRGFLDGVVFSGGEPTFQKNLPGAAQAVREMGFKVGLHTAGPDPERLEAVLPWVNWVGFDIKAPFDQRYDSIVGKADSAARAKESLRRLIRSGVAYQLRTTVHPALLSRDEVEEIQRALAELGAAPTVIQPFRPEGCADRALCLHGAPA